MDTERNIEFLEILKERLTEQRLYHSICVAKKAKELAFIFGGDPEKAYTAGLVHDIMRYEPADKMLELIESDGQLLTESEKNITVTLHAIAGEVYLRKNLNVTDEEILSAVRWHTTGKENMSLLEKIIYVADMDGDNIFEKTFEDNCGIIVGNEGQGVCGNREQRGYRGLRGH